MDNKKEQPIVKLKSQTFIFKQSDIKVMYSSKKMFIILLYFYYATFFNSFYTVSDLYICYSKHLNSVQLLYYCFHI